MSTKEVNEPKQEEVDMNRVLDQIYGILDQHREAIGEISKIVDEKKEDHQAEFSLRLDNIDSRLDNTGEVWKNDLDVIHKKIKIMWIIIAFALVVQFVMMFINLVF